MSVQYASDYAGVSQPIAYKLYEDAIDLSALRLSNRTLTSIGFTNAEDAFGATDVMAIDGASAVPEPAALTLLAIGGLGLSGAAVRRGRRGRTRLNSAGLIRVGQGIRRFATATSN